MNQFIFVGLLSVVMGIVSAISGGSGVFAVPTLLAFGIPPINTLVLNRMSDVGIEFGALWNYHKSKNIDWKLALIIMIPLAIGSFIGAKTVLLIPEHFLKFIIILGVFLGIFFLLKPVRAKEKNGHGRLSFVGLFFMALVGIWSGALAMAGGTFAVLVLVYFFHKNFLQAKGTDITAAIPETLISTAILFFGSTVSWKLLLVMFIGSFIGAWIGAHLAIKHGSEFIRKTMVGIAILMIIKVVADF